MELIPLVSKIQRYSTKDGPGIRSTVFFLGCNLHCLWCSNPELITDQQKIMHYQHLCKSCGYCVKQSRGEIKLIDNRIYFDLEVTPELLNIALSCPNQAYEVIGQSYNPEVLVKKLLADKEYYLMSDGGVTFSGGEPLLYPNYLLEVFKGLKKAGIKIAIDTAGYWAFAEIKELFQFVDTILFDVKCFDAGLHQQLTGKNNQLILENLKKVSKLEIELIVRMIIVPNVNDDISDILKRFDFVSQLPIKQIDVLFYHNLGVSKYASLNIPYHLSANTAINDEVMTTLVKLKEELPITINLSV